MNVDVEDDSNYDDDDDDIDDPGRVPVCVSAAVTRSNKELHLAYDHRAP